jgi:hypothetical protein
LRKKHLHKRRTRPGFLSDEEAARDRTRTKKMVKSFAADKKVTRISINCNACGKPIALLVE